MVAHSTFYFSICFDFSEHRQMKEKKRIELGIRMETQYWMTFKATAGRNSESVCIFYPWNGLRSFDPTRWIKMSAPTGTIMFRCVYFCIEFSSFRSRSGYLNSVLMSLLLPLIGLYSIFIWPSRHTIPRFVLC